jgi:hypothetical protein
LIVPHPQRAAGLRRLVSGVTSSVFHQPGKTDFRDLLCAR